MEIAPWLELGYTSEEGQVREKYIKLTLKAISNAVNPSGNDYIFVVEPKQSLVDVALFAQGLLRAKNQIWLKFTYGCQARIIRELKNTRIIAPYENHWLLYTSMIEAALLEFTGECDKERLTYMQFPNSVMNYTLETESILMVKTLKRVTLTVWSYTQC